MPHDDHGNPIDSGIRTDPGNFERPVGRARPDIPVLTDVLVSGEPSQPAQRDYEAPRGEVAASLAAVRVEERMRSYLHSEGRALIEARCRETLHRHTTQLVEQLSRDVTAALETRLAEWARDALRER